MTKPKIDTMQELAAAIKVSRPTLSRYFQDPESVSATSARRIREGLERVEFVPNFFFTRLNRKSTGLIGVIIPHLSDAFFTSLLDVIELGALKAGYTVITQCSHGDPAMEVRAIETLLSMNPDGILVAPLGANSEADAFSRLGGRVPFVFIDSRLPQTLPDADFVGTDNDQSVGTIVKYLCRTGEAPAFLSMPRLNSNSREREEAYLAHMQDLGHEPCLIDGGGVEASWEFEDYALRVMDSYFSRGKFIDRTILCANDRLAFGVIRAANDHGLFARGRESAGSMRIAGHDDNPVSRFMSPTLTTVEQNIGAIGRAAIEMLSARINDGAKAAEARAIRKFDAALKVRESA